MPTPTDDRRDLLTAIANMRARPGKEEQLREALLALEAHLSTPHLEQFTSVMGDLLDERGLSLARLRRIA